MADEALRNHAFRVLDLVVDGHDETAKAQLVRLSTSQLEAMREVLEDVRLLIDQILVERPAQEQP